MGLILRCVGFFVFLISVVFVQSQTFADSNPTDAIREKVTKAKAYIALKNYVLAIYELEQIRHQTKDETIHNLVNSMLMNCYLEQRDYRRAQKLLEDVFNEKDKSNALQNYFSIAAQALKGIRTQVERYKALGLSFNDKRLPDEAIKDIEKLRELSELIIQQSKSAITQENSSILLALIEESSKIRSALAKDEYDSKYWKDIAEDLRQDMTISTKIVDAATEETTSSYVNKTPSVPTATNQTETSQTQITTENFKTENKGFRNRLISSFQSQEDDDTPLQIGSLIEYATKKTTPIYPPQAKIFRASGIVRVEILIDESGKVLSVEKVSGPAVLQPSAIEAVKKWEFKPFMKNGKPVKAKGFVNFNFNLQEVLRLRRWR
jgi:TonB family protein